MCTEGATKGNYNQPLITYHILPIRIQCKTCLTQMPSYVDSGSKEWMGRIRDLETRANTNSNMQSQLGRSINAPLAKSSSKTSKTIRGNFQFGRLRNKAGLLPKGDNQWTFALERLEGTNNCNFQCAVTFNRVYRACSVFWHYQIISDQFTSATAGTILNAVVLSLTQVSQNVSCGRP